MEMLKSYQNKKLTGASNRSVAHRINQPGSTSNGVPVRLKIGSHASSQVVQRIELGDLAAGAAVVGGIGLTTLGTGLAATVGGPLLAAAGFGYLGYRAVAGTTSSAQGYHPNTTRAYAHDPVAVGGSYRHARTYSQRGVREADHTPPKSTYAGTPYAGTSEGDMPAVSVGYDVHRDGQGGAGGGVSTTGSSTVVRRFRNEAIHDRMRAHDFEGAMIASFNDQRNAAPNPQYLVQGQVQAAYQALQLGHIDQAAYQRILQEIYRITY